jgi:hypothetical protein
LQYSKEWYGDPSRRDEIERRREWARSKYEHAKRDAAELNAEFRFEEDPNNHVPERYRDYLMRALDQIFKDDPNAEANVKTWRKVMQAVITGDPREIERANALNSTQINFGYTEEQLAMMKFSQLSATLPIIYPSKPFLI